MKCKALFFALCLPLMVNAQNLVPNWSFEDYEECPDGSAQIHKASGWMSFRLTPDFFHACNLDGGVGVPDNLFADNVPAIQGNAYAGFGRDHNNGFSEVLATSLVEPLVKDSVYYVSFYVRRILYESGFGITNCWNDKIGATFSMEEYQDWPEVVTMPINNSAHVYHPEMIVELETWTKIEGYYQADSSYQFIAIGYHFDEDSLNIQCEGDPFPAISYFFLDCICVAKDPINCPDCEVVTSIEGIDESAQILVYPNPFYDQITIDCSGSESMIKKIQLSSIDGRIVLNEFGIGKDIICKRFENLKAGLYILMVEFENGLIKQQRIIKN